MKKKTNNVLRTIVTVVCGAMIVIGVSGLVCQAASAATVTKDGIMYRTCKVTKQRWVQGGPNYRYQATLVKVKASARKHYTIPRSVTYKKRAYVVTEIVGDPFLACRKARTIAVRAPLAYVEDQTFWRVDRRKVKITVWNCGAYDYLMGGSTALIQ